MHLPDMTLSLPEGQAWRAALLEVILRVTVLLGAVVYAFSVYKAVQEDLWPIVVVDTVVLAAVTVLWRWRSLPFGWRAGVFCVVIYLLGAALVTVAAGVGQIYLLGQSVLVTVLLGLRAGLVTVAINSLTPFVVGTAIGGGWIITPGGWGGSIGDWALISLNFLLIALMLVVMVGAVLQNVERALRHEVAARRALDQERALLQARERHLQTLIDATPEGVLLIAADGRVQEVNRAGLELLQATHPDEVVARPVVDFIVAQDRARFDAVHRAVCGGAHRTLTCDIAGLQGTPRTVEVACAPLRGDGVAARHLALVRDVTVRLRLEEQLREPQRLDALGKLTGGMAHDFNNLLTVVLGNADVLASRLTDRRDLQAQAEMVRTAAERGAELIHRLLAFAGRQALAPRATDVARLVTGMESMLRRTLGEHIRITLTVPSDAAPALVDPAQLEAAVLNLSINARDAMPEGGRLKIDLAEVQVDDALTVTLSDLVPAAYLRLRVADTGTGMSPQVRAKAVEPFFTTKDVGRGTGLGLSMVYGFVRQSDGAMHIDSEPGRGTCIDLYLPRATHGEVSAEQTRVHVGEIPRGHERILIVEDEDMVREYVVAQLQALGYRVVEATDGGEALARLQAGDAFDLLFTDMRLPDGMTGRQVADAARALWPGLPVLFTTGYTEGHGPSSADAPDGPVLHKPYARADLARRIRAALDAR